MEPNDVLLKLFLGVYGAGYSINLHLSCHSIILIVFYSTSQAQRWIAAGYKSLDELSKKAKLTTNQKIGVEHYEVSRSDL